VKKVLIFIILLFTTTAYAAKDEGYYRDRFCSNHDGKTEYYTSDQTIIDCLTKDTAWVITFANKWDEAVGKVLNYGRATNKKIGIIVVVEDISDMQYISKLINTNTKYNLDIELLIIPKKE